MDTASLVVIGVLIARPLQPGMLTASKACFNSKAIAARNVNSKQGLLLESGNS